MNDTNNKLLAAAISRLAKLEKGNSFDAANPRSKPTKNQLEFFKGITEYQTRVIRAGNRSGKTQSAGREVAWILNNNHPYFNREDKWDDRALTIMIVGQSKKMVDAEIWSTKIAPFLNLADWKISRSSAGIEMAENKNTGDRIVFLSHADSSEKNRKNLQGYTAQYVWVDEMPSSAALFQEIQARSATDGMFVATFSPKFKSDSVRRVVDAIEPPYGYTYRFSMLDNPILDKKKEMAKLEGYPVGYKNAVLYGDWYVGDSQVYEWIPDMMVMDPEGYTRAWPHVESVDPALKSKFGYTMWAQQPSTGVWYLVRDEYIEKIYSPDDMVKEVIKRGQGYNIVRRVCDPHEAWYIGQASKAGVRYTSPYDKNNRKSELIKGLQFALSRGKIKIASWALTFQEEVSSCQWSETAADKMINSSSYHTLDCSQYFVDCMPKDNMEAVGLTWEEQLRQGNRERKKKELKAAKNKGNPRIKTIGGWGTRRAGRKLG